MLQKTKRSIFYEFYFSKLNSCFFYAFSLYIITTNVVALGEGGVKKYSRSNLESKIIESTNVEPSGNAPLAPNACCA
jgi:hypothetical protein